jgi:hypothetical protein
MAGNRAACHGSLSILQDASAEMSPSDLGLKWWRAQFTAGHAVSDF